MASLVDKIYERLDNAPPARIAQQLQDAVAVAVEVHSADQDGDCLECLVEVGTCDTIREIASALGIEVDPPTEATTSPFEEPTGRPPAAS